MKKLIMSLLLLVPAGMVVAQEDNPFVNGQSQTTTARLDHTPHFFKAKPVEKYETKGSEYLYTEWRGGTIVVNSYKAPLVHNQIKLDLMHDMLELHWGKDGVKVMDGHMFDTLYLQTPEGTQTFVRAEKLNLPGNVKGICEVLYDGKFKIVKTYYTKVLPANYNVALMVGRKYDELVVRSDVFVVEGSNAYELPKKKNEMLDLLERYFPTARKTYKIHKPLLKDEASLLAFIQLNLEPQQ